MSEQNADQSRIPGCSQCGKAALMQINEAALCVDCYYKFVVAQTLQFQQHAAMMNMALAEMDAIVPFGPSYRVQMPQLPNGSISNTNVTVTGGVVGSINTGTVQSIVVSMKGLGAAGHHEIEKALHTLTESVIQSGDLDVARKNEILEQVEYVATEAAKKPEERKSGMLKTVVSGLAASLGATANLATVWEQVGPVIKGALGL